MFKYSVKVLGIKWGQDLADWHIELIDSDRELSPLEIREALIRQRSYLSIVQFEIVEPAAY